MSGLDGIARRGGHELAQLTLIKVRLQNHVTLTSVTYILTPASVLHRCVGPDQPHLLRGLAWLMRLLNAISVVSNTIVVSVL